MVWYSHLFKSFPQFVMIHAVKDLRLANETEVFLEFPCFLYDPANFGSLISGSSAFSNSAWTSGCSRFTYCWRLAQRILNITLLAWEMSAIAWWCEHSSVLPFLGIGMRIHRFQSCGHCWVFQICWRIECSTFTASSFRIWNGSAGIPSPSLALLSNNAS